MAFLETFCTKTPFRTQFQEMSDDEEDGNGCSKRRATFDRDGPSVSCTKTKSIQYLVDMRRLSLGLARRQIDVVEALVAVVHRAGLVDATPQQQYAIEGK